MKLTEIIDRRLFPQGRRSFNHVKSTVKVYEGLIRSESPWFVVDKIRNKFKGIRIGHKKDPDSNLIVIRATLGKENIDETQFIQLLTLINTVGWYCSWYSTPVDEQVHKFDKDAVIELLQTDRAIIVQIEAKYDVEEIKFPKVLYHATPSKYANKVKKIGLTPKSKAIRLQYPDRIYLASNLDNLVTKLVPDIADTKSIRDWTIFQINDLEDVYPKPRLYRDPLYPHGYYVLVNIPPSFITELKTIKV